MYWEQTSALTLSALLFWMQPAAHRWGNVYPIMRDGKTGCSAIRKIISSASTRMITPKA